MAAISATGTISSVIWFLGDYKSMKMSLLLVREFGEQNRRPCVRKKNEETSGLYQISLWKTENAMPRWTESTFIYYILNALFKPGLVDSETLKPQSMS